MENPEMRTSASVSFADSDPDAFRQAGEIPAISTVFLNIQIPLCVRCLTNTAGISVFSHVIR